MEFKFVELGGDAFAFQNDEDGKVIAEITWTLLGDVMVMDHTYVSETLQGQGIAKKLLDRAAEYAREHEFKLEAVCSYVVTAFERYKDYDDIKA